MTCATQRWGAGSFRATALGSDKGILPGDVRSEHTFSRASFLASIALRVPRATARISGPLDLFPYRLERSPHIACDGFPVGLEGIGV